MVLEWTLKHRDSYSLLTDALRVLIRLELLRPAYPTYEERVGLIVGLLRSP